MRLIWNTLIYELMVPGYPRHRFWTLTQCTTSVSELSIQVMWVKYSCCFIVCYRYTWDSLYGRWPLLLFPQWQCWRGNVSWRSKFNLWKHRTDDDTESSIICDSCLTWFHFSCLNMKKQPKYKVWFCRLCYEHAIFMNFCWCQLKNNRKSVTLYCGWNCT